MKTLLTLIKMALIKGVPALALIVVTSTVSITAVKWSDWNLSVHSKEALSILDTSSPILDLKAKLDFALAPWTNQRTGYRGQGTVAGQSLNSQTIPTEGRVAISPEIAAIPSESRNGEITQVIKEINNYTVKASLTEQELVGLISSSQTLTTLLKGDKGDKGDPGVTVGYTLPTSTNTNSIGTIAGFTHLSGQDLSSQNLTVSNNITQTGGTVTLNNITVTGSSTFSGAGSFDSLTVTGNVGIGTTTVSAKLHTLSTTEQLRLGYDASNYSSFTVSSGGALSINPSGNILNIGGGTTATDLRFLENSGNGSNYVGFKAAASLTGNVTWTLPTADGTSGQVLQTDGAGNLSWVSKTEGLSQDFKGLTLRTHPDADKAAAQVFLDHADEIVMDTGNRVSSWDDLSANIAASGAGGLDTMPTTPEAASTWYEIYAIRKSSDGTKNLLLHRAKDYFKDEEYTDTVESSKSLNQATNTVSKIAQTFSTDFSGPVEFADVSLDRDGTPSGRIWLSLYVTSGGAPTGSALVTSDKLDASLMSAAQQWIRFVFRSPYSVTSGTTYALVLEGDTTLSDANYVNWGERVTSPSYSRGQDYTYNGSVWSAASRDLNFKLYVTRNDTSVTMPAGFDQKAKVGYVYNDGSSNFKQFTAIDRRVTYITAQKVLSSVPLGNAAADLTSFAAYIPPGSMEIILGGAGEVDGTSITASGVVPGSYSDDVTFNNAAMRANGTSTNTPQGTLGPVVTGYQAAYILTGATTVHIWIESFEWGSSSGADLAEEYLVHDESITAGDVVSLTDEPLYIEKASVDNLNVFGIVSTKPGLRLTDFDYNPQNNRAVALSGRVPVKFSNENGEVKVGDRLTLSKTLPGYSMKQTSSGQSIGMAMESSIGKDKVLTFVNLSYWTPVMQLTVAQSEDGDIVDTTDTYDLNGFSLINVKAIASISGKWSVDEEGILRIEEVQAKRLCLDQLCITREELQQILDKNGVTPDEGLVSGESTEQNPGSSNNDNEEEIEQTTETPPAESAPEEPPTETLLLAEPAPEEIVP